MLDPIEDAVDTLQRQWDAGLEELVYLLAEHILGIVQRPGMARPRRVRWLERVCESFRDHWGGDSGSSGCEKLWK